MKNRIALILFPILVSPALGQAEGKQFSDYWYAGKAEVSRFELKESRYGQARKGHAVMVFVTEDFHAKKQVKTDSGRRDAVKVLKLNTLKKFNTGVYDYSLMSSVFTPVSSKPSLKLTASVQEWCGQVYQQLNLKGDSYRVRGHSYFASEGDEDYTLRVAMLENEVWTRIRLDPKTLPLGKVKMIPSAFDARLRHRRMAVQNAETKLEKLKKDGKEHWQYSIRYPAMRRSMTIVFEKGFPHRIHSWREDLGGGRVTEARRTHSKRMAYWNQGSVRDLVLRDELGLPKK